MNKPTSAAEPLLTVAEAATALNVSIKTVRRRIDGGLSSHS